MRHGFAHTTLLIFSEIAFVILTCAASAESAPYHYNGKIHFDLYEPDGYWRGPVWARSTMIIAASLDQKGVHSLSDSLKERFCIMAQKSGMAENFDAETGDALQDPAYSWTSSIFLLFAHELAERREPSQRIRLNASVSAHKHEDATR